MPVLILTLFVHVHSASVTIGDLVVSAWERAASERTDNTRFAGSRGQATTEYALVLLAAAMVALLVIAWASAGGGAAKISSLFNKVVDSVINRV